MVTISREYHSNDVLQGVFGVDVVISSLTAFLETFHPVAGVSGSCVALLTTAGELVASSHPLPFGPSAVFGPVSNLTILNNNGSLPLDPFSGAMELVFGRYDSLDRITAPAMLSDPDYIVALYPLSGLGSQGVDTAGISLPLVVVAAVSTAAYLPSVTHQVGLSIALTVLVAGITGSLAWKWYMCQLCVKGRRRPARVGDSQGLSVPVVVGCIGFTLSCFLLDLTWSYHDSDLIRSSVAYLALQSNQHITQTVKGFSAQTAALNSLNAFLLNTTRSAAAAAVYAPTTMAEEGQVALLESFLTVVMTSLAVSIPIVTQAMFGFDDGLFLAARVDGRAVQLAVADNSTDGHLTLFDVSVNGTRNVSTAREGLRYDPRQQDWWYVTARCFMMCVGIILVKSDLF